MITRKNLNDLYSWGMETKFPLKKAPTTKGYTNKDIYICGLKFVRKNVNIRSNLMSDRVYGQDEKQKLERLVNEGAQVMQEVEDLTAGLKDTVKAVAEELNMKPALINKAIKVAHKGDWSQVADAFDDLETLVVTVGKDK